MYIFTYKDYINCLKHKDEIDELKRKLDKMYKAKSNNHYPKCNTLNEESEKYIIGNKASKENNYKSITFVNNEHDKVFRKSLDNKNEVARFLNKTLNLKQNIVASNLEKYNSSFVTKDLKNQESDVIYKLKR